MTMKTIGNNPQCQEEKDLFSVLPMDLKEVILLKLPAKSVAKLALVSKLWSVIVSGKAFTDFYMARCMAKPRLLITASNYYSQFVYSCSQEDPSFSDHGSRVIFTPKPDRSCRFSPSVRGLICCQHNTKVLIGNPSTGQLINLPKLETRRTHILFLTFFGYDPFNDVYKVLSMTIPNWNQLRESQHVSQEHQVLTLGGKEKEWRRIECKHPHHTPYKSKGICMNGVVYYYAWTNNEGSLISFDVSSEEYNVIMLPEDDRLLDFPYTVNYSGKIALMMYYYQDYYSSCTLDFRVLEDASKQEWSKVSVVVPSWGDLTGYCYKFFFECALSTGKLIFATRNHTEQLFYISYDLKENNAKKVVIEGTLDRSTSIIKAVSEHVECPIFLSNVT